MSSRIQRLLQRCCLRPTVSLRRQLLISFGSSALLTLTLVVLLTCLSAHQAGQNVHTPVQATTRHQVLDNFHVATRNQALQLTRVMENIDGNIQLVVEYVRDRIVGYPYNFMNNSTDDMVDAFVPFVDRDTGRRKYPLDINPLPADWQIYWNVVPDTASEHLQERAKWLRPEIPTSTATAGWFVQGVCDPEVNDDALHWAHYPNCTDANNDLAKGGVVQPTPVAGYLHSISGDLCVLLKPLFEAQLEAYVLFIAFVNDGAGAVIQFPGIAGRSGTYVSQGCDWLLNTTNPYTGRPLGTPEQVARCHPKGTTVVAREYNPLERSWFQTIALADPEAGPVSHGPFRIQDSSSFAAIMFGKAIYDRM